MLKRNRLEKMDITAGADSADLYQVCFSFPIRANDQICEEHQIKQMTKKNIRIISGIADVVYKQGQMDRSDSIAARCP